MLLMKTCKEHAKEDWMIVCSPNKILAKQGKLHPLGCPYIFQLAATFFNFGPFIRESVSISEQLDPGFRISRILSTVWVRSFFPARQCCERSSDNVRGILLVEFHSFSRRILRGVNLNLYLVNITNFQMSGWTRVEFIRVHSLIWKSV